MKLLVDMGNSRMKFASHSDIQNVMSVAYDDMRPLERLTEVLDRSPDITLLVVVSVLGVTFERSLKSLCEARGLALNWVASEASAQGIENLYDKPETLGSDRFVALVGAVKQFPSQCCIVVDCGTAVTVDGLSADGTFTGGVILPGLSLWGESLIGQTSQLKENNLISPPLFASNTADAIGGGSIYGLVGAIEGICARMKQHFVQQGVNESSIKLLLCGGDAQLVASHANLKFTLQPNLVLMGLAHYC